MVGLSQGTPNANQPVVNPTTGTITQPWLQFLTGLANNASQSTLPDGIVLPPGSVDLSAFNKFLTPIGLVNSLPAVAGYEGPSVIFNSADGNLYRLVNDSWTLAVPGSAVVGQVPLGAIPSIPTTQLTGYIQAAQIQANSIGADQISAAYIYAGSIAASQITAGALSAGVILTSSLSAAQITTGTLTGITISGNTVSGNTITGGTITGTTIQTASSGARLAMGPSVGINLNGYNTSGTLVVQLSPDNGTGLGTILVGDNASLAFAGLGTTSCVTGDNRQNHFSNGGLFYGVNASSDAINCGLGGLTFVNGYIHMGGGSITGVGTNLTSTASTFFIAAGTNITMVGNVLLNTDNTYTIGSSSFRASVVYSAGGVVTTSDEDMKVNIQEESLGLDFINTLAPSMFNLDTDPIGAPLRHGLLAQQVETSLAGTSFAGLHLPSELPAIDEGMGVPCSVNGMTPYGLNYSEFIGPIIKSIQELSAQVKALQAA